MSTSWVLIKIGLRDIHALTFAGLRYALPFLPAVSVRLLLNLTPIVVSITRVWMLMEKPTSLQWMRVLLYLAGGVIYFNPVTGLAGDTAALPWLSYAYWQMPSHRFWEGASIEAVLSRHWR